jgi:magnesium transporter
MARLIKNRSIRRALPPGGFNFENLSGAGPISGHYIRYNANELIEGEFDISSIKSIDALDVNYVHWFHIDGFAQEKFLKMIHETFHIPMFQMADVLNIDHHPKIEDLDDLLFFLLKSAELNDAHGIERLAFHHLGVFLGHSFVLTFSEKPLNVFNLVKERIRHKKGRIREKKEDFLFYSLIDAIVDNYFYVVEVLGNEVEDLEKLVFLENSHKKMLPKINRLKMEFLLLRKLTVPVDEAVQLMNNLRAKLFDEDLEDFLIDLQDHSKQLVSVINGYYTMLNDILQIYAASINLQTNRIITFLTLFTSIFIPLTFIVGVYGMNFKHMPELDWKYGYGLVWLLNIAIATILIVVFRKKKWL